MGPAAMRRELLSFDMAVRVPLGDGLYCSPQVVRHVRFQRSQSVVDEEHRTADAGAGKVWVAAQCPDLSEVSY